MDRQQVAVSQDHLARLAKCKPESAIEELIWNGLDAGGHSVDVRFQLGGLTGDLVEAIEIEDHGAGIPPTTLARAFGTVGDSAKVNQRTTSEGHVLHGSEGKGRFKAFALGKKARWRTTYSDEDGTHCYDILIERSDMDYFRTSDPKPAKHSRTGTILRIDGIDSGEVALLSDRVREYLAERLALYLKQYPKTRVRLHGRNIDTSALVSHSAEYELPDAASDGQPTPRLTVLEWSFQLSSKKLMLCDDAGFAWSEMPAGVKAKGLNFTAYLCCPKIREWNENGRLALAELDAEVKALVDAARIALREHVRTRLAQEAQGLVQQWKDADVYPYAKDEAETPIGKAERQVFDIVATRVHEYHDSFREADPRSKRFLLRLVREALESNPTSVHQILREVLELPADLQDELADLLKKTDLKSIVQAVRTVTQRLDTIQGFDRILFDKDWKQTLLERSQLHRLLVHQLWILGEDYTLDIDDESLRKVLHKHLRHLGRDEVAPEVDVKTIENRTGIVDLMLSRQFRRGRSTTEHLVVELKRPSLKLGSEEITQIKKYAYSVCDDERFDSSRTQWTFMLLGNDFDKFGANEASADALPYGCIHKKDRVTIWIKRWAEVLADAKERYEFFRERLEYEASGNEGLAYLQEHYGELLSGRGRRKGKDEHADASSRSS